MPDDATPPTDAGPDAPRPAGAPPAGAPPRAAHDAAAGAWTLDETARAVARSHDLERRVQQVADALPTPEERAVAIIQAALDELGASSAVTARLTADGARLELVGAVGVPAELERAWRDIALDEPSPVAEAVRSGRACFCESRAQLLARFPGVREMVEGLGVHAVAAVPVRHLARVQGAVAFGFAGPRRFAAAEKSMLRALGGRYARALQASRSYYAEREARAAEAAARRTAEEARAVAEAAARAQRDYVAVVSHELRTPLQAILGYAELLTLGTAGALNPTQGDYVDRIVAGGTSLLHIVENLLGFSAAQIGRQRVDAEPFDLSGAVCDVVALAEPLAARKALALRVEAHAGPAELVSDRRKLQQIVTNLVANAIKFTERGEVLVRVDAPAPDRVRVAVRDTGVGIPASELPHLFEPFWQGAQRPAASGSGTGLGLSIVRQLARLLGGDVSVASTPGAGSTFTVELPTRVRVPADPTP